MPHPVSTRRTVKAAFGSLLLVGAGLFLTAAAPAAAGSYYATQNLVTNFPNKYTTNPVDGRPTTANPAVQNAWGLALRPAGAGGHWWIGNNGTGTSSTYIGDTDTAPLSQDDLKEVAVAPPTGGDEGITATPTGMAFSGSTEFPCTGTSFSGAAVAAPSKFLVVTEDGNLQCWTEGGSTLATRMASFTIVHDGDAGSIYKGLAVTNFASGNRLIAANFGLRRVEVYDGQYHAILPGAFARPADVPADYAPFNIATIQYTTAGGTQRTGVFIVYAATEEGSDDEVDGPGLGAVAEFDTNGVYVRTLQSGRRLNAPWGMALAPAGFGRYGNRLLVGNFGDGTIVAFDLATGQQRGYLRGFDGQAVQIDGLWGLAFGNGVSLGRATSLYFTAGPSSENDGVFGSVRWVADGSTTSASGDDESPVVEPRLKSAPASPASAKRSRSHAAAAKTAVR